MLTPEECGIAEQPNMKRLPALMCDENLANHPCHQDEALKHVFHGRTISRRWLAIAASDSINNAGGATIWFAL